jgi:hypothetical protein
MRVALMLPDPVRHTARRLGVGRALLKVHALRALSMRGAITLLRERSRHLPRILCATPISAADGEIEIHMLLHHQRILEGIWALYSLAYFAGRSCQILVHSDGSLTPDDAERLERVLPGTQILQRRDSDLRVGMHLEQLGYAHSARFRKSLIFALKLFDPFFYGTRSTFVLLDSDVLFFEHPSELLNDVNVYSPDNGVRYCLAADVMQELLGRPCTPLFNPGVLRVSRDVLDLERVEQYLHRPEFWGSGTRPHYYAELTLWAMQLTLAGARPLSKRYAITPSLEDELPVSGHYCGGGYPATWFYSRALPHLARELGV